MSHSDKLQYEVNKLKLNCKLAIQIDIKFCGIKN